MERKLYKTQARRKETGAVWRECNERENISLQSLRPSPSSGGVELKKKRWNIENFA